MPRPCLQALSYGEENLGTRLLMPRFSFALCFLQVQLCHYSLLHVTTGICSEIPYTSYISRKQAKVGFTDFLRTGMWALFPDMLNVILISRMAID